jgi:hypothetical protein
MRHSIMGERDGIDKERAEIGMSGLWSGGCRAQRIVLGHGRRARVCDAARRYCGIRMLADCAEQI